MSPDGRRVAVGDIADYRVRVFDRQSGEQIGPPLTYFTGIAVADPIPRRRAAARRGLGGSDRMALRRCHPAAGDPARAATPMGPGAVHAGRLRGRHRRRTGRPAASLARRRWPSARRAAGRSTARTGIRAHRPKCGLQQRPRHRRSGSGRRHRGPLEPHRGPAAHVHTHRSGQVEVQVDWSPDRTGARDHGAGSLGRALGRQRPAPTHRHAHVQAGDVPGEISNFPTFSPDGRILVVGQQVGPGR